MTSLSPNLPRSISGSASQSPQPGFSRFAQIYREAHRRGKPELIMHAVATMTPIRTASGEDVRVLLRQMAALVLAGNWRELQKRAPRESAPLDALFLDAEGKWVLASDLPPNHEIHTALALDRERCRKGFLRAAAAK